MKCIKDKIDRPTKSETILPENFPEAVIYDDLPMMTERGSFPNNKPQMLVIHFTAGHQNRKGRDAVKEANKNKYGYLFITDEGELIQQCDLTKYYYHAGKSKAPSFTTLAGKTSLSKYSIGIEIAAGGKLSFKDGAWRTWFKKAISNFRQVSSREGYIHAGTYQKYTDAQENKLFEFCIWASKRYGIPACNIVGHDEIAPDRKNDPGGALSVPMPQFRKLIAAQLEKDLIESFN